VADDVTGAVRRTPNPPSTGDHQTPETSASVAPGATNPGAPVSPDAENISGELSPEVAAALVERHGPEIEALAATAQQVFATLGARLAETPKTLRIGHVHDTSNDMQAFLELPDCLACEGTGKDTNGSPFEAPLAVHFAAPCVTVHGRRRQLCLWCGHVLMDDDLTRPTVEDDEPIFQAPWPDGALVKVEDGYASQVPYRDGDELPPGCCALPDDEPADDGLCEKCDAPRMVVDPFGDRLCKRHLAEAYAVETAADRQADGHGPDEAQETRAAADWPPEPVNQRWDEREPLAIDPGDAIDGGNSDEDGDDGA